MCKKNYVKKIYFVVSALMFEDVFVLEGAYIRNCFFQVQDTNSGSEEVHSSQPPYCTDYSTEKVCNHFPNSQS